METRERREIRTGQRKERCKERQKLKETSGLILSFFLSSSVVLFKGLKLPLIVKLQSKQPARRAFPPVD